MRSPLPVLLACAALLAAGAARADEAAARPAWRICLPDIAAPPYLYNDPERPGLIERLLEDAARRTGRAVVFMRLPPRRCRATVEAQAADGVVVSPSQEMQGRYLFPQKAGAVDVSRRVASFSFVWIKRRDSAYGWSEGRLSGGEPAALTVGTRTSVRLAIEALRGQGFAIDDTAMTTRQLLLKLAARRVDLGVAIQEEVEPLMSDPAMAALVLLPQPFIRTELHLALRKDLPAQELKEAEAWWSAIGRLRDTEPYRVR